MNTLGKFWTASIAYVALGVGAGLSIMYNVVDTMTVRGAALDIFDVITAVAAPGVVVLMVEMFVARIWVGQPLHVQAIRWLATSAIGGVAMRTSWTHGHDFMARRGQAEDVATLWPLAIDLLAIMATALILASRRAVAKPNLRWVNPGQVDEKDMATYMDEMAKLENVGQTPSWATPGQDDGHGHESADCADSRQDVYVAMAADEAELAKTYATVGDEASDWLASLANHPDLDKTTTPAVPVVPGDLPQRKRTVKYDRDRAVAAILASLEQGSPGAEIDQSVAEAFGISERTARRLRAQVTGQPVSGPPSDSDE